MSKLMQKAGFEDTDAGPFVTELREMMTRKQAEEGLISTSPGTWADGPFWEIDPEVRARELLAVDWSLSRGHSFRVECLDPPIEWQFNTRDMSRSLRINWRMMPAWLGDRKREFGMHYRIWRDRKLVNPYRPVPPKL